MTLGQGGAVTDPSLTQGAAAQPAGNSLQQLAQQLGASPTGTGSSWTAAIGSPLGQAASGAGLQYGGNLGGIPYNVWNSVSTILGYDARQAFLDYVHQSDPAGIATGATPDQTTGLSTSTNEAETFLNTMLGAAMANPQNWVIRRAQDYWAQNYGGELPASVIAQITQAVAAGGPSLLRTLQSGLFTTTTGGTLPNFVKDIVDNAAALDPSTKGQAVEKEQAAIGQQRLKQYVDTFGHAPALGVAQLAGMDSNSWQDYLNNQQYRSGMTLGQYTDSRTLLDNAGWMHWFGGQPSDADVKWAMGKSNEDITARIDQSPYSAIPGMNIGTYKGFSTEGDTISKALFGASLPDHLIQAMSNAGIKP